MYNYCSFKISEHVKLLVRQMSQIILNRKFITLTFNGLIKYEIPDFTFYLVLVLLNHFHQ